MGNVAAACLLSWFDCRAAFAANLHRVATREKVEDVTRGDEQPKTLGPETVQQDVSRTVEDPAKTAPVVHEGGSDEAVDGVKPIGPGDQTELSDDILGRVIAGKYRLMSRVGKGGMGSVYEAIHLQTERRTALKILNRELSGDLKVVARFRREAMAASRLNHENCVAVYDFGEDDDGTFFISMEFVDGRGLGTELRRGGHAFDPPRVMRIGAQILAALDAAHAAGIIHRDLKPQNVMVTELAGRKDFVKVVDFGIAKFVDHAAEAPGLALTMPGTIFGTPEYMSPEQARGEELDGRSDVYSAAVVLWHMLLGRSPFKGQNVRETLMNVFQMDPPRPSEERPEDEIPRSLENVLLRALEKDPAKRIQSPAAMLSELAPLMAEASSPGRATPRLPTPGIVDGAAPPETLPADYLADGTRRPTSLAHGGFGQPADAPAAPLPKGPIGPPLPEPVATEPSNPLADFAPRPAAPPTPQAPAPNAAPASTPPAPPASKSNSGSVVVKVQEPELTPEDTEHIQRRPAAAAPQKSAAPLALSIVFAIIVAMAVGGVGVLILMRVVFPGDNAAQASSTEATGTEASSTGEEGEPGEAAPSPADVTPPPKEDLSQPARAGTKADRRARDAAISRAEAALARENLEAAKAGYADAIRADRRSAKAHKGMAMVAYRMGDLDTAKVHLERIMELDSEAARQIFGFHAIVKKKIRDRDRKAAEPANSAP